LMPDKMILGRTVVLLGLLLLAGASSVAKKPALGHEAGVGVLALPQGHCALQ